MQEFQAPVADTDEIDPDAARPGWLPIIGGTVLAVSGLCMLIFGLQLLVLVRIYTVAWVVPWIMLVLGVAALLLGGTLTRARDWAAFAGVALSVIMALLSVGWGIYAILSGFFSLLGFVSASFALLAVPAVLLAVPGAISSSRARRALYR